MSQVKCTDCLDVFLEEDIHQVDGKSLCPDCLEDFLDLEDDEELDIMDDETWWEDIYACENGCCSCCGCSCWMLDDEDYDEDYDEDEED